MRYGILNQGHGRQQRDHSFSLKPRRKHRRIREHDLDGLIAHLQDRLQIQPEQQEVWQRFAFSVREAGPALLELRAGHAGRAGRAGQTGGSDEETADRNMPLNERLDALEQRLHMGLEVLSKLRAPLAELNRVLDDRQREKLERWFAQRRWR
jgi:uncharacterized coiled-coil protein SlyX